MTAPPTTPATPPRRADVDLESLIERVEQRLVAREDRLRRGAADLAQDLRRSLRLQRLLLPACAVVLGMAALLSLRRTPAVAGAAAPPGRRPWAQWLALALPLLPARWRDRLGPATTTHLLSLGLPLLARWAGGPPPAALQPAAGVDLARLTGRWFLVGELASPLQPPATEPPEFGLLPRDDGQLDLLQRRVDARGTHGSEARVDPVPGSHGARWRVSHWPEALHGLDWAWSDLVVLHLGETGDDALIGSPSRDTLWLLSRRTAMADEHRAALVQIARDQGFDVKRLRAVG